MARILSFKIETRGKPVSATSAGVVLMMIRKNLNLNILIIMNLKITHKDLKRNFSTIVSCPYADLNEVLSVKDKFGYNAGVYGWNFNAYDFGGTCLITGYRPRGADFKLPFEFCEFWENKASNASFPKRKEILKDFEKALLKLVNEKLAK